ncbi:MAG TPA: MBL fold metallo-hydrolase [Gemmatimonadales bacterium]|nr:MBL fold metallo-hydrolase [Gemmatimonadales bacterium]
MLVRRFYDDRLAQASYLIGCQRIGEAIVVDPARDITPYLEAAKAEGMRITRVTETHIHADFVSGARELAAATGATPLLSAEGGSDWQYAWAEEARATLLRDGDTITLGGVRLEVWHTPGHTPEHLSFVVIDTARSEDPVAMLTGDFIFVGDVGRPDLLEKAAHVEGTMEAGARQLFRSIQRTASLPDHLQIWPGHGAGSACGKALGAMPTSTLGYERRTNWAFGIDDETAFVTAVLEGQPTPPAYFGMMKRINKLGATVLGTRGPTSRLDLKAFDGATDSGAVLDVRPAATWAGGHLRGTLNIPLIKAFTTWAGWLLNYEQPITLVADTQAQADDARRALASIGLDRVRGWLDATQTMTAFPERVTSARRGDITQAEAIAATGRQVIDLRETNEWDAGHLPVAAHHPLGTLRTTLQDLPRETPLAVHCQAGTRSAIGISVLAAMGFTDVMDLNAGYAGWRAAERERSGGPA